MMITVTMVIVVIAVVVNVIRVEEDGRRRTEKGVYPLGLGDWSAVVRQAPEEH